MDYTVNYSLLLLSASTIAVLVATLVIARLAFGAQAHFLEGYDFREQALERDNPAILVRFCGLIIAALIATAGAYRPSGLSVFDTIVSGTAALVPALIAIFVSRAVTDRLILHRIDNRKVVEERDLSVAIVEFATYVATAMIFVGSVSNPFRDWTYSIVWFLIGQAFLVFLAFAYRLFDRKIFEQVGQGNPACSLSLAGLLISGGLAVAVAIKGATPSLALEAVNIVESLLIWVALMAITRVAVSLTIVSQARMTSELTTDHNWAVGLLVGFMYVAITAAFIAIII
jgi:hypothetical protein